MIAEDGIKEKKPTQAEVFPVRVFRPRLELKKCKKTYGCYAACPENAIVIEKGFPKINYDVCTGCLICLRECPCGAITEERE
ncbi:MAG: 4Fe-4S binding protein [Candidatus Aenigmarchaeota archaeon]|nr:4Fe-4S binding protein [Candidatus Aenigmarchaeota archaeon]